MTLSGAKTGFRAFSSVCSTSDTVYYSIQAEDASGNATGAWETGYGTYSGANTLTRTYIHASSNGGAAVSFSAGTKSVWIDCTAARILASVPIVSASAPANPFVGMMWTDADGITCEYFYDGTTYAWLDMGVVTNTSGAYETGSAVLDFGASPGNNEASVSVTGLTSISASATIVPSFSADATTSDHTASDHKYASAIISLSTSAPSAGTGFTIYGRSVQAMQGTFSVQYVWRN